MRTGILVPQFGMQAPGDFGVRAEELGYDSVWAPELWGRSGVVHLSEIAARTTDIDIGSAILNVFSRSPAVLAMDAASIDGISDGRMHLGLGTSTEKVVEDLHGESFENPVRHAHETIELVNAFLSEEGTVAYDSEVHHAADFPSLDADVPVYHAALGTANRRVVARLCDGWIPHNIPWPELDDAYDYIVDHAAEAGRDGEEIEVAPYVPSAVSENPADAKDAIRGHVAYYVGNGEGYRKAVAERFPETADAVADAWRSGDRSQAADEVTDEMVEALGVAGTPETAREKLITLVEETPIDRPLVTVPNNAVEELGEETMEALAPEAF
jgi:alkanesulfonate monooxygenase SsuD/methylene tetrahydromethanopterin reductase-like flavin-dependent oxidoreductase (luciferase family)